MKNYKIIGKCPFGTGELDENGMYLHPEHFLSDDAEDYINGTGARLALEVARDNGAKPLCVIEVDGDTIEVYKLLSSYGTIRRWAGTNMWAVDDYRWRNTINPAALVNYHVRDTKDSAEAFLIR